MISLTAWVNMARSKGLALLNVDMTPSSKGDRAFARLRASAEPSEQEANDGMFLATCPLGELYTVWLILFFWLPTTVSLSLSEPETYFLALATGKAWYLMEPAFFG